MPKRRLPILILALALFTGAAFAQVDESASEAPTVEDPAYSIRADAVRGAQNPSGPTCVLTPVFLTGEQVVWRAYVFDAETGEKLTPEQAEERGVQVTVVTENGDEYEMEYGLHPREEPQVWMWVAAWQIPPVYPTGALRYHIVVEDAEGNQATWEPLGQDRPGGYTSLITIERR